MGVMNLNEEVEKILYYVGSSKAVRMSIKGRSTERAPGWVERADKIYPVASCSTFDQAARPSELLLWSSGPSDALKMLFLTLQVLKVVSLSFIHSFNVLNVA